MKFEKMIGGYMIAAVIINLAVLAGVAFVVYKILVYFGIL